MSESRLEMLWMRITGNAICSISDCESCLKLYNTDTCPVDIEIKESERKEFVQRVLNKLRQLNKETVFDFEMTDEEFISILNDCIPE